MEALIEFGIVKPITKNKEAMEELAIVSHCSCGVLLKQQGAVIKGVV